MSDLGGSSVNNVANDVANTVVCLHNVTSVKDVEAARHVHGSVQDNGNVKNVANVNNGHAVSSVNNVANGDGYNSVRSVNNIADTNRNVQKDASNVDNMHDVNNMKAGQNNSYRKNGAYVNNAADVDDLAVANGIVAIGNNSNEFDITDIDHFANHTNRGFADDNSTVSKRRRDNVTPAPTISTNMNSENDSNHPPTSYFQSIVHLFKGNIGPGLFAMGDAFKNGGLLVAPILTIAIAFISIHCQHVLINCSNRMREANELEKNADYAETVEQCFERGPTRIRSWAKPMRVIVNIFICVTQLGFCCIYFVFISTNTKQILGAYEIKIDVHLIMMMAFVPILLTSLITNLKWLTPVSLIANICMVLGLSITLYYALYQGLPEVSQRNLYTEPPKLALFFGTAIFAFEGIALVLPLKNAMKKPENFERPLGVLNVGMFFVSCLFLFAGAVGYMKWGEQVGGSLTLNLGDTILAQCVKAMVSLGVLFGYPLQFFIAVQIMWPNVRTLLGCQNRPYTGELLFRTFLVLITLGIAELVPELGLFISLIGSLCSTALALVFPPIIEMLVPNEKGRSPSLFSYSKNIFIILLALLGFSTGTYESLTQIIKHFGESNL